MTDSTAINKALKESEAYLQGRLIRDKQALENIKQYKIEASHMDNIKLLNTALLYDYWDMYHIRDYLITDRMYAEVIEATATLSLADLNAIYERCRLRHD